MVPLWVIYTTFSGLTSVGFNFISRSVLKDGHDSTSYSWWFEFFRFIIFIFFAIPVLYVLYDWQRLILFLMIGLCEFLSIYFYMKMHASTDLSISSVITQARLIWVPVLAFILLSEELKPISYLGIIIILIGQLFISINKKIGSVFIVESGIKYALISTFFVSLNNVLAKSAANQFPTPLIPVAMATPSLFLFPFLMRDSRARIVKIGKLKGKNILFAALFNAGTMVFLIWALRVGEVSKVTALYQSISVLQVFLGIIWLNENKNIIKKVIGAFVVLIGVYLLV